MSQDEIDAVAVLRQQIDEYERMRDFADEGRTESLQALIEKTEQIIAGYEEAEDQAESKLCVADTNTTLSCSTLLAMSLS